MWRCIVCKTENPDKESLCKVCQQKRPWQCPMCDEPNLEGNYICLNCSFDIKNKTFTKNKGQFARMAAKAAKRKKTVTPSGIFKHIKGIELDKRKFIKLNTSKFIKVKK